MKIKNFSRILVLFVCLILAIDGLSFGVFAVDIDETKLSYYHVVSKQEWQLAPGIIESEIVMNNVAANKRQVSHIVEIDINNPYTKIIPSTYKMADGLENKYYSTQIMSEQAKYAEENGYGNVVAAMNTSLHWYDTDYYTQHPELIGEPLGTLILDGVRYTNSQNSYFGAYTCIVINFDEKNGQPRPDNIPKVEVRQTYDAITGWEEQLIPASFHFLVKDGVNQHSTNDPEPAAPRSMMGIKADGTIIIAMIEGRQAPFSTGFNAYEMAEFMISLGCVQAINCDGGGSATFLSQRPGENLELHCSPSDGTERPVTHGVLIISTVSDSHTHVPGEKIDKAPTATEPGYTDRVLCTICGAIIEDGTEIPTIDHTYSVDVTNKKIVCDCGYEFSETGLQTIDGKNYYAVNGVLTSGWIGIEDDWYFFDKDTFEGWEGERYTDDAIKFTFDNGKVTEGTWVKTRSGIRYWYGPGYYRDMSPEASSSRPYVISGKTYLFNRYGYMQTGFAKYFDVTTMVGKGGTSIYYDCGEDGVASLYTGPYGDYFYVDGNRVKETKIVEHNGDFYYIGSGYKLAKNTSLYFESRFVNGHYFADGTPMHVGRYEIDADGKFIIKNGPVGNYFYKNDVIVKGNRIVEFEGNFYYVGSGNLLAKNTNLYFSANFVNGHYFADGTPMHVGRYDIDADGKFIIKNGPVGNYFYKNDVVVKGNRIVEFEGNIYYVGVGNCLAKDTNLYFGANFVNGHYFADGTPMHVGRYDIDADGKFIIKNGPVGNYFYKNDVIVKGNRIVEFEGNIYYVGVGNCLAKDTNLYFGANFVNGHYFADGTPMHVGRYDIDADGKFIIKNGPVGNYFYKNDIMVKGNRIVEFEGNYYYVGANNLLAKNTSLYFTSNFVAGTTLNVGRYEIDADGRLIAESGPVVKNGPVGDYFYRDGKIVPGNQLVQYEGDWYYVGAGNKLAKNCRLYFTYNFVVGKTFSDGCMIEIGYHTFDENGKMIY